MVQSSSYLGTTTTLSPVVPINVLQGADPVDVCGYLCTTNAPNHATRGVCKQFYVAEYVIEWPFDNAVMHTASCTLPAASS